MENAVVENEALSLISSFRPVPDRKTPEKSKKSKNPENPEIPKI